MDDLFLLDTIFPLSFLDYMDIHHGLLASFIPSTLDPPSVSPPYPRDPTYSLRESHHSHTDRDTDQDNVSSLTPYLVGVILRPLPLFHGIVTPSLKLKRFKTRSESVNHHWNLYIEVDRLWRKRMDIALIHRRDVRLNLLLFFIWYIWVDSWTVYRLWVVDDPRQ